MIVAALGRSGKWHRIQRVQSYWSMVKSLSRQREAKLSIYSHFAVWIHAGLLHCLEDVVTGLQRDMSEVPILPAKPVTSMSNVIYHTDSFPFLSSCLAHRCQNSEVHNTCMKLTTVTFANRRPRFPHSYSCMEIAMANF